MPSEVQMATETWIEELRAGRANKALDQLRQERPSPSNFASLGAAYMWAGDFQSALAHFQKQIQSPPPQRSPGDLEFGMAGSAAWCLGDTKLAIQYWRKGTEAAYAVGGANTRTALLLYFAAIMNPETFSIPAARELLAEKANHWRIKSWPGPIAEFVLGTRSEEAARQEAVYKGTKMEKY